MCKSVFRVFLLPVREILWPATTHLLMGGKILPKKNTSRTRKIWPRNQKAELIDDSFKLTPGWHVYSTPTWWSGTLAGSGTCPLSLDSTSDATLQKLLNGQSVKRGVHKDKTEIPTFSFGWNRRTSWSWNMPPYHKRYECSKDASCRIAHPLRQLSNGFPPFLFVFCWFELFWENEKSYAKWLILVFVMTDFSGRRWHPGSVNVAET